MQDTVAMTVRIPQRLLTALRVLAATNRRTMGAQTTMVLEKGLKDAAPSSAQSSSGKVSISQKQWEKLWEIMNRIAEEDGEEAESH